MLQTTKLSFEKMLFQKPTSSVRFNLLQVCPSVPSFVFAVLLLIPSFNVMSDYQFHVSLSLGTIPTVRIF